MLTLGWLHGLDEIIRVISNDSTSFAIRSRQERPERRPERGLVCRLSGRRRADVLRQVPEGVPPELSHTQHQCAAGRKRNVAVPAVRQHERPAIG